MENYWILYLEIERKTDLELDLDLDLDNDDLELYLWLDLEVAEARDSLRVDRRPARTGGAMELVELRLNVR